MKCEKLYQLAYILAVFLTIYSVEYLLVFSFADNFLSQLVIRQNI